MLNDSLAGRSRKLFGSGAGRSRIEIGQESWSQGRSRTALGLMSLEPMSFAPVPCLQQRLSGRKAK